jgi:hypothetical protein
MKRFAAAGRLHLAIRSGQNFKLAAHKEIFMQARPEEDAKNRLAPSLKELLLSEEARTDQLAPQRFHERGRARRRRVPDAGLSAARHLSRFDMDSIHYCPVCGFGPFAEPYACVDELRQSFEICPCCGCEYGHDDCEQRLAQWVASGCQWFEPKERPENWSLDAQLRRGIRPWPPA